MKQMIINDETMMVLSVGLPTMKSATVCSADLSSGCSDESIIVEIAGL